jgi:hypothetical protein
MADDTDTGLRQRSRRSPVLSLQKALERAEEFKKEHGTHAVRPASAYKAWGYAEKSSGARQTLATLIMYGIFVDSGIGEERRVKLSELAQRYLIDQRPAERAKIAQRMVLAPEVMLQLWEAWNSTPPGDSECRSQLIFDYGFTETGADEMLAIYKDNIAFVNPNGSLIESEVPEPKGGTQQAAPPMNTPRPAVDKTITVVGMSTEAVLQGLFTQAPVGADLNQLRIRMDGDRLQIAGLNVDLEGIDRLRKMLEKYEEILRLQKGQG